MQEKLKDMLFAIECAQRNREDNGLFRKAFEQAFALGVVNILDVVAIDQRFMLNQVNDWCRGRSTPPAVDRAVILGWLKGKTEVKVKRQPFEPMFRAIGLVERNPENEMLFREAVRQAFLLEVTTLVDAATGLCVSMPTINRWCMGQSAPHPLGRIAVMQWLKAEVEKKIAS